MCIARQPVDRPECSIWLVNPKATITSRPGTRRASGKMLGRAESLRAFHSGASSETAPSVACIELSNRMTEL
jgi:hypothetical protein